MAMITFEDFVPKVLWEAGFLGEQDVNIRQDDDYSTPWSQLVRVWFEEA
jgi:hypothetical protein